MWQFNSPSTISPVIRGWMSSGVFHLLALGALVVISNDRVMPVRVSLASAESSPLTVEITFTELAAEQHVSEVEVEVLPRAARIDNHYFRQAPSTLPVDTLRDVPATPTDLTDSRRRSVVNESLPPIAPPEPTRIRRQVAYHHPPKATQQSVAIPESRTTLPEFHDNRPPNYPESAISRGWEGTVILRLALSSDGRVTDVTVLRSSGHPVLDAAAVSAVRMWTATPATKNGRPIATTVRLPVTFRLP